MYSQVFPVLWNLVCLDVFDTWKIAPLFQKHSEPHIVIAEPLEVKIMYYYDLFQISAVDYMILFSNADWTM